MTDPSKLVERLRVRAQIRRQIPTRKSVQEGKPDRIADLLEEAATALESRSDDYKRGLEDAAKCRSAVPILPGDMPDEMWTILSTDRDAATEALRIVVRQTLDEYEQAIRAKIKEAG